MKKEINIKKGRNSRKWIVILDKKIPLNQFVELHEAIKFARTYFNQEYCRNYLIRVDA